MTMLCAAKKEAKKTFTSEILGADFSYPISIKGKNHAIFAPLNQTAYVEFYEHAIWFALNIGGKKYDSAVKNHGSICKLKHCSFSKKKSKNYILKLKAYYKQYVLETAAKEGKSHTTQFTRELNCIFAHNAEADTIDILSYHTKRRIYYTYYWTNR